MKNFIKKILIFGLPLISTIAFAFPADPNNTPDPPAPIDNCLFGLVFLGIGLAFLLYSIKTAKS